MVGKLAINLILKDEMRFQTSLTQVKKFSDLIVPLEYRLLEFYIAFQNGDYFLLLPLHGSVVKNSKL